MVGVRPLLAFCRSCGPSSGLGDIADKTNEGCVMYVGLRIVQHKLQQSDGNSRCECATSPKLLFRTIESMKAELLRKAVLEIKQRAFWRKIARRGIARIEIRQFAHW